MDKKTILIWIFVTNFLTLIFLILQYFGLIRYFTLKCSSHELYVKNYSSLPKAKDERIVVSLTTTVENIKKIKPVLMSLLDQTVKVDEICLNIPIHSNGSTGVFDIPKEYTDMLVVYKIGKDYGELNKIIPTLLREGDKDTNIIYINDLIVYGKDFIEKMVESSKKNPNKIIVSTNATLIKPDFIDKNLVSSCIGPIEQYYVNNKEQLDYNENYHL